MSVELLSPAKLNLRLKVTGVREDGYHLLESLFVPISLYDRIDINDVDSKAKSNEVTFSFQPGHNQDIKDNTVEKSLLVFKKFFPQLPFLKIHVKKHIPMGAGLGGGEQQCRNAFKISQ